MSTLVGVETGYHRERYCDSQVECGAIGLGCLIREPEMLQGVFGWLQADTVAAVWTAAAAIHREKNTVEAAAAAGLQPQQAAANKTTGFFGEYIESWLWQHLRRIRNI
jgi:hypothetical protein